MTWEDIRSLLADRYDVDYDRIIANEEKQSSRGDTDRPVFKYGW